MRLFGAYHHKEEVPLFKGQRWLLELMDDLFSAGRSAKGESVKLKDNDRHWIHTLPSVMDELVKLDLATCTREKRKPGRPRKEKPVSDAPKRPRGRPRKNP